MKLLCQIILKSIDFWTIAIYILSTYIGSNVSKLQETKQLYSRVVQTICNEIPLTSSGTQSWIQVFIRTCTSAGSFSKQLM